MFGFGDRADAQGECGKSAVDACNECRAGPPITDSMKMYRIGIEGGARQPERSAPRQSGFIRVAARFLRRMASR